MTTISSENPTVKTPNLCVEKRKRFLICNPQDTFELWKEKEVELLASKTEEDVISEGMFRFYWN